jgi:geranylgeranyl reductase family protein
VSPARAAEVVVVGAGPAGSSTAYFLARAGVDVLLVDRAEFPREKVCGDGLTPRALAVLNTMGVLPRVESAGFRADDVEVFSPDGRTTRARINVERGAPSYAVILPRITLDDMTREQAVAAGARFAGGVLIDELESDASGIVARGKRGEESVHYRADLVVIATGASTSLLARSGILARRPTAMLAARAYFEQFPVTSRSVQLRFDGVPLPGYGWVFPLPGGAANVGAGYLPTRAGGVPTAKMALERWLARPAMRALLRHAEQRGAVKGYPLRVDFLKAPAIADRVVLVGEAAGLVNPLTGEGIDYALESGQLASEHIVEALRRGSVSRDVLSAYDFALRERFGPVFHFCERVRDWFLPRPALMNVLVRLANWRPDLKAALVEVTLGGRLEVPALTPWLLARALLAPVQRR